VLAGDHAALVGAVVTHHDVGELPGRDRLAAADVENLPGGALVGQHEDVGVHHVVDVDVVADRRAVLVQDRREALQVAEAEDAAGARGGGGDRLPRARGNAVAQREGGGGVPAGPGGGDHARAALRRAL